MHSIRLLGPPQIVRAGQPVALRRRKARALVYYLAEHNQPLGRDHLAAVLWPDLDRPAGQQSLRTVLHEARKVLGDSLLTPDDTVALASAVEVDARTFAARLATLTSEGSPPAQDLRQLETVLALYRGDFLEGFSLPDSPEFDNWLTSGQERYRRLAVRGLAALSQAHDARQNYAAALDALARALALDPLQEDLQRAALRLHYLAGDRAGAIRRYEALRHMLDQEMGVPPMEATRALYDAIIRDEPPTQLPALVPSAPALGPNLHPAPLRFGRTPQSPISIPQLPLANDPPSLPNLTSLPFAGRAAELQALREASAAHRLALVEGPAGIGKTRLAREYSRLSGAQALAGTAHEMEQALPYQPIIEALRGLVSGPAWPALAGSLGLAPVWLSEIGRLLPELAGADGARSGSELRAPPSYPVGVAASAPVEESRLWEAVHQFLSAVARQHRLVVFLDDLHWADTSTLGLLGYLVRRNQAEAGNIFYLGAARPAAPRSPLALLLVALTREDRLIRVRLDRLSPAEIAEIASAASPTADPLAPLAGWLERQSEGNPYILAELLRHAGPGGPPGGIEPDGGLDEPRARDDIPPSVYSLIRARLERLSEAARRVLDAAVAAGREFDIAVAGRAAGLSEAAALDALDELRAAGLVSAAAAGQYAFDHTLTMEVAYREATEERHRLLHRRVAEAMESLYRSGLDQHAGVLAAHFAEGGSPERAAHYAFRAGQRAVELRAWPEAIAFFEQALSAGPAPERRLPILLALGQSRLNASQPEPAAQAFRAALSLAAQRGDRAAAASARFGLVAALMILGRIAEVVALVNQMCADDRPADQAMGELLMGMALALEGADLDEAARRLASARERLAAQPEPDLMLRAQASFELGNTLAMRGDLARAVDMYREVLAMAEAGSGVQAMQWQVLALNNLAYHLHLIDPFDPQAQAAAEAGLALAQENGALSALPFLRSTVGELALARGDLASAEAHFREGLALAEQTGMHGSLPTLQANLGLVAARRGETAVAVHRLTGALDRAESLGNLHLSALIRTWLAGLLPPAEARQHLARAREIAEPSGRARLLDEIARAESQISNLQSPASD
jgi:DNA-binding SARP family transcriptional activator